MGLRSYGMTIEKCVESMAKFFFSDTIELLDMVLEDDIEDPQYSAIIAVNRLWTYLQYKQMTDEEFATKDVETLLSKLGYAQDVDLLRQKAREERKIYHGTILETGFF